MADAAQYSMTELFGNTQAGCCHCQGRCTSALLHSRVPWAWTGASHGKKTTWGSLAVAQVIRELQAENLRSLSSSRDMEGVRAASQHWQWVLTGGITAHPGDRNTLPLAGLMAGSEVPSNTKQRELHKCSIFPRTKTAKRKTERM